MNAAVIPEPIAQLQLQLNEIRSTRPREKRLPDSVWQAAVELAREHGVYSVARHLRLDYTGLKKRLGGVTHLADEKYASQLSSRLISTTFSDAGRVFD